jgi:hypothetical protein
MVQGTGWFISQEKLRLIDQGPDYGNALSLTTAQLAGPMMQPFSQPDALKQTRRAGFSGFP